MPLIDSTYFENSNIVANINEPDPDAKTDNVLNLKIIKGERDVLSFAFGFEMWEDFKQYIGSGIAPNTPENYRKIIEGDTYIKDGINCFWIGLIEPETKESLIADYVYCTYHDENQTQTSGIGEVKIDNKVGNRVSMTPKTTKVWNRFIEKLQGGFRSNPSGFTLEGKPYWFINGGVDYYGVQSKTGKVSLMHFLMDNKELYPLLNTDYRRFGEFQNEWGI
ncbi:hypothetical protein BN1195_03608 [Chryseobacterium oranimense G311]|uniref:hypothetical protein n=1 Tax=Chryseobacterium oranimense TaxID=421058 RepID=UPI000533871F|nr:hypothetical protein [Chryseobacterium oranimense]CEJ71263.1 hypothetical protein BN1195_03608 [Chryseobacterium oranimense G311]DAG72870.1 MAG TPA: hypothetical protein [Caudoviricetes sp.]